LQTLVVVCADAGPCPRFALSIAAQDNNNMERLDEGEKNKRANQR
jgi:hypothetical protein